MQQENQEAFENAQKEIDLQVIDLQPVRLLKTQKSQRNKPNSENVNWKFNALSSPQSHHPKHHHKPHRNISFEGQNYEDSYSGSSDEDEYKESDFTHFYRQEQGIYKKKMTFGTNWIGKKQYFTSVFIEPTKISKYNLQYYTPESPFALNDLPTTSCSFDSEFESGNLHCAFKVGEYQYDLLLQNDLNTKGNTQWFYFRLTNPPKHRAIKINIVNLRKSDSLFNYGLMPCIYSFQEEKRTKKGWFRGGKHIKYFKNNHPIQNSRRCYSTLTFTISTIYDKDTLLIAHSFPYSVSDLNSYLDNTLAIKYKSQLIERQTLATTVGKNKIEVLTIKEPNQKSKSKPLILVLSRQHPGQTPGSFVCQGFINFLLAKDKESEYLRKNYQFKIIPMVNPDGVAAGNYRTNLHGFDLNRRWHGGNRAKNLHQSTYIKKYFNQISKNREVAFIIDLHGHSRKLFSFFYGNPNSSNPIEPRIYPLLCSKLGPSLVRFEDSTFMVEDLKRNTARVQLSLSFKTPYIYTFEVSFYGYFTKDKEKKHFTVEDMRQLGEILGRGLFAHERGKQLFSTLPDHKDIYLYKKCVNELRNNNTLISLGEQQNSGSESSPQQCQVKQSQELRLENNDDYNCNKSPGKVKIVKKIRKAEPQVKEMFKSSRQMQVLDIAQVHSAFPSNIIALIPNSYLAKFKRPPTFTSTGMQTDEFPLMRVFELCQRQDQNYNPESSLVKQEEQSMFLDQKNPSNLLRSSILTRPKTTTLDYQHSEYVPLSVKTQRKSRDIRKRQQSCSVKKPITTPIKWKMIDQCTQTSLSFIKWNSANLSSPLAQNHNLGSVHPSYLSTISSLRVKLSNEVDILEYKSIDPYYSTFQNRKGKSDNKSINKAISKNIIQNLKNRRRN